MSSVSESTTIIQPTLHHINLKTKHLQEMIDWYATVVGMTTNYQFPGGAWLTNDAANHRLALLTSPQLSEDPDKLLHTGIHHSAFEYATMGDLLTTYTRLKALGIEPHACLDHGMTTSFYYEDPDGNSVELQSDNFATWQESSEWQLTAMVSRSPSCIDERMRVSLSLLALWICMSHLGIHVLPCRTSLGLVLGCQYDASSVIVDGRDALSS